jgi:hypothetical protein
MYCTKCGAPNDDNAFACTSCGQPLRPPQAPGPRPNIPTYLVHSILVTLLCCLPFGIVGIVYAAQVDSKITAGDINGALESSRKAKNWTLAGFICGLVIIVVWLAFAGFMMLNARGTMGPQHFQTFPSN